VAKHWWKEQSLRSAAPNHACAQLDHPEVPDAVLACLPQYSPTNRRNSTRTMCGGSFTSEKHPRFGRPYAELFYRPMVGCSNCRNPVDSTSMYAGAIETAEEFGKRIYLEAWKRGWWRAEKKVVMGDGAEWIWNIAQQRFPGAIQIVDLYHARQHLWGLTRKLYPNDEAQQKRWIMIHKDQLLDEGKIEELVASLQSILPHRPNWPRRSRRGGLLSEERRTDASPQVSPAAPLRRLGRHRSWMQAVIGARCKQSGMFWTVRGANAILALRCCHLNGRFEEYWETRRAA